MRGHNIRFCWEIRKIIFEVQCWKRPVARWPNAPNFCLGPLEITKLWTLVAQNYLSGNSKWMGSSASGYFGPLKFWTVDCLGHHINFGSVQHWSILNIPSYLELCATAFHRNLDFGILGSLTCCPHMLLLIITCLRLWNLSVRFV